MLWLVLAANLIGMLFQALSTKLGILTSRNLMEMCQKHLSGWSYERKRSSAALLIDA